MTQNEYENTINGMLGEIYKIILPLQTTRANSKDYIIETNGVLHISSDVKATTFMPKIRRVFRKYEKFLEIDGCYWDGRRRYINLKLKERKEIL